MRKCISHLEAHTVGRKPGFEKDIIEGHQEHLEPMRPSWVEEKHMYELGGHRKALPTYHAALWLCTRWVLAYEDNQSHKSTFQNFAIQAACHSHLDIEIGKCRRCLSKNLTSPPVHPCPDNSHPISPVGVVVWKQRVASFLDLDLENKIEGCHKRFHIELRHFLLRPRNKATCWS